MLVTNPPNQDPLAVGVLGCSDIARRRFIPALRRSHRARLAAVSSRSMQKAKEVAPHQGCLHLTHEQMLQSPSVELVYLSFPNHLHEYWTIRALEAGKHVMCEKPLAPTLQAVEHILSCAAKNNLLVYENQMFLFHPQHEMVKSFIRNGSVGKVKELRCFFTIPLPGTGNYRLDPLQGGGAFQDLVRYPIGLALHFLVGNLVHFTGDATWKEGLNVGVRCTAMTDADESLLFSIAFDEAYEATYEIVGDTGKIRLERGITTAPDYQNRIILFSGAETTEVPVPPADHFQLMIDAIADSVKSETGYEYYRRRAGLVARIAADIEEACLKRK